jgi:hypothetical protein
MHKYNLALILLLLFSGIISAQAPIIFGEISKADLQNKTYCADTSAPAVVLCDYGYYTFNTRKTVRILRIKMLKKEGYSIANQTFSTDSRTSIHGITYNLVNDAVVETKLKPESVFKTRISEDNYEVSIAMPEVKVGSIMDIKFEFEGIPLEWDFQQEIPVVHSELVIEPSMYIMYHKNFYGNIPLTVNTGDRWVAENVPAFKPEPFTPSSNNLRSRFEFDVEFIIFQNSTQNYTTSWNAVRNVLYSSEYFGYYLDNNGNLKSVAATIKSQCTSREELLRMAFAYAKTLKWDGISSFYTNETTINAAFKKGSGNSAEVNLALVQLLRKLDFDATPVVLSTRNNGYLSTKHPSINKLNYVIAAVFNQNDTILLDATEANCPYYLLPKRVLNGSGQIMDKKRTGWIELNSGKKEKKLVRYSLSVNEDKILKGNITYSRGDYSALGFRNYYKSFNSDEAYLKSISEDLAGLKIVSHKIENLDSLYKPVSEELEVEIRSAVSEIDGELYIIPMLYDQMKENPFNETERKYPVDFTVAQDLTVVVNYSIPKGYKTTNLPQNQYLKLHGNAASFIFQSTVTESAITLTYKLNVNKTEFLQSEYADLREFYKKIVLKEAEPIVLKKI